MTTLADDLRAEEERLRRRFIHHTRPTRPVSLSEAIALAESISPLDSPMIAHTPVGLVYRRSFRVDAGHHVVQEKWDLEAPGCPMIRSPWGLQSSDRYYVRQIIMSDQEYEESAPTLFERDSRDVGQ